MAGGGYQRFTLALIALVAAALAVAPSVTAGPAPLSCSNAGGVLTVTSPAGERLTTVLERNGDAIEVGFGPPIACSGPAPTVHNVDLIDVRSDGGTRRDAVFINLENGPLAPGATDEGDGSSEIEIAVDLGGDQGDEVQLTTEEASRDRIQIGRDGRAHRVNANRAEESGSPDSDLVIGGVRTFRVYSHGGGDRISGRGAPGATRPARIPLRLTNPGGGGDRLIGGDGDDAIAVGRNHRNDDVLKGGRGRDVLAAARGDDRLVGGNGRDALNAGGGGDSVSARDGKRDKVKCGGGTDRGKADALDRLGGCERVRQG